MMPGKPHRLTVTMRKAIRTLLPPFLSRLPDVRGRGRMTLLIDRLLTDEKDPDSYNTIGILNGNVRFQFDLRPWGQKFAYYYRSWESNAISTFRALYRGGWFIDVGSSLGLYVVCMADVVRARGGRIAAIEPVPFNRDRQNINVALNNAQDLVEYAAVALGSEPGQIRLAVDPLHADNNAYFSDDGDVEVEVVTLDALCASRRWSPVGAIKMDVEGYEPKVFEGARETVTRDRPVILAEFNRERMAINGFSIAPSWDFLHGNEYRAYVLERGYLQQIDDPGSHENLFFIPAGMQLAGLVSRLAPLSR